MRDQFAVLGLERAPVLEAETLEREFQSRAAVAHPDVTGGDSQKFRDLNAAHQILRDPARRLRHLLALEAPQLVEENQTPPPEVTDLFMQVGKVLHKMDTLMRKQSSAGSALSKALLAPEKLQALEEAQAALQMAEQAQQEVLEHVQAMGANWRSCLDEMAAAQRRLAFYGRWMASLRERLMALQSDF